MEENNNISDEELHELLKSRLLSEEEGALTEKLTDMQANILFAAPAAIAPPALKEQELLAQTGQKAAAFKLSFGWVFTSLSAAAAITITSVFLLNSDPKNAPQNPRPLNDQSAAYKASPVQAEAANTTSEVSRNNERKNKRDDSLVKIITSLPPAASMENAAPAASTQTVSPVGSETLLAISETRTATPSVSDIKCAAAQPVSSPLKPSRNQNVCRIWKTKDLCATPDSLKFPYLIECDNCEYNVDCKDLSKKNLTAVIFRIYKKSGLTLDKGFKSIQLIKPDGRKLHPSAISVDRYMNDVRKLRVNFKNVVDVILLFSEAEPGDRILIDYATEAVIEE